MGKTKFKDRTPTVTIYRNMSVGGPTLPPFVGLAHRHLEKEGPKPSERAGISGETKQFNVPIDLVRLSIGEDRASQIESITFSYRRSRVSVTD